jgi:hypothetical protein
MTGKRIANFQKQTGEASSVGCKRSPGDDDDDVAEIRLNIEEALAQLTAQRPLPDFSLPTKERLRRGVFVPSD